MVRILHWTLACAVTMAWLSTLQIGVPLAWHEPAGYTALGCVSLRGLWGLTGSHYARFSQFVRGPAATWRYARLVWRRQDARHIGHNPLGGWMVLSLLGGIAVLTTTGWLQTTDAYWGSETLEWVHSTLAWSVLALVPVHVAGVVVTGVHHRENLVRAMLDGRKMPPSDRDVA